MATTFPTYPATTFEQAVELAIFSSNQLHNIINADATSVIETEDGNIPSVRYALIDNLYFKTPAIDWEEGLSVTIFNQLYTFSGGTTGTALWYAPTATTSNPITTGTSPEDDDNWRLYGWDTYSKKELNSTSGASYIGTSDGSNVQSKLDITDKFIGAYEDQILTIDSKNCWITYNGLRWVVSPSSALPITTTGTTESTWENDYSNFIPIADGGEVFPEYFGSPANGVDDDSAGILAAFKSGKKVKFTSGKTYNAEGVEYTGRITVDATGATIVGDKYSIIITDGAGSRWKGGTFKSKTTPWTVVYNSDFSIKEQGYLGYGRMPFQDDTNVDSTYYYQDICGGLAFISSSSTPNNGVFLSDIESSYASIVVAGYTNVIVDHAELRGGQSMGALQILNGTYEVYNTSYANQTSATNKNSFKWAAGSNHLVTNSKFYESRANGLLITGSDSAIVSDTTFKDNAESGFKTGQYIVRDWTDTDCINTNLLISSCNSSGNYYDGFDISAAYGSGLAVAPIKSGASLIGGSSYDNRKSGVTAPGNKGLIITGLKSYSNGTDGIIANVCQGATISAEIRDIGLLVGRKYGIYLSGTDNKIISSDVYLDDDNTQANYNYYLGQDPTYPLTKESFTGEFLNNTQNPTWALRSTLGADVFIDSNFEDISSGISTKITGKMPTVNGSILSLAQVAGNVISGSHPESGNSAQAIKKPGANGIWLRVGSMAYSPSANSPVYQSLNWFTSGNNDSHKRDDASYYGSRIGQSHTSFSYSFFDGTSISVPISITTAGIIPGTNNLFNVGSTSVRFANGYFNQVGTSAVPTGNIYTSTTPIVVSDANQKPVTANLTDTEINCAKSCAKLYLKYKLKSSIEEKGENFARWHTGVIAQEVISVFESYKLDWKEYGIVTYEKWGASEGVEAGEMYMVRYDELNCFINAGQEARLEKLENLFMTT